MYSAFDRWAYLSHMLTVISMFSPCTQWVFGPLSPVSSCLHTASQETQKWTRKRFQQLKARFVMIGWTPSLFAEYRLRSFEMMLRCESCLGDKCVHS